MDEDILNADSYPQYPEPDVTASTSSTSEDSGIGGISFVQCATGEAVSGGSNPNSNPNSPPKSRGRVILIRLLLHGILPLGQQNFTASDKMSSLIPHPSSLHLSPQQPKKNSTSLTIVFTKRRRYFNLFLTYNDHILSFMDFKFTVSNYMYM